MSGAFTVGESRGIISTKLDGECVTFAAVEPMTSYSIVIPGSNGRPMVTIHPEGRMEFGEHYEPNEAARAFWDMVKRFAPSPEVQQFGAPLAKRVDAELARGQRAEELLRSLIDVYRSVHAARVEGHVFEALKGCAICDSAATIRAFLRGAS